MLRIKLMYVLSKSLDAASSLGLSDSIWHFFLLDQKQKILPFHDKGLYMAGKQGL